METVVRLRDVRELFEQPARVPLDPDYEPWCVRPAAEHVVSVLRADPSARVALELPPGSPETEGVRAALGRYGDAHADELTLEIRAQVRSGLLALLPTALVFAGALALSRLADSASSHWVSTTVSEALVVVGWVVLWAPVAIFGTDIWILRSRRRAYGRLAGNAIDVRVGTHEGVTRSGETRPMATEEARLEGPRPTELSKPDYFAVLKRAGKEALNDNITNIAAALAYYAFLAIPSVLLVAVGVFSLVAGPGAVTTIVAKLGTIMPGQATSLIRGSLNNMTKQHATGITIIGVGGLLAFWSVGGAMQNLMWALNVAYDRKETRGFLHRRGVAYAMAFFLVLAFALVFGLLVLGPKLSHWIGSWSGQSGIVSWVWWAAQWPLLLAGLLLAFAAVLHFGPNVEHPRWRFLTPGALVAVTMWLVASGAFAFYVSRFGSYNKTWGALSAVVMLLTWFWLSALALLFGAKINAEAERSRELQSGEPAEVKLQAPEKA